MKYCEQRIPDRDPQKWTMGQLKDFGRIRLSSHFFMRDMLYSEVASVHGIRNVPDKPRLAVEVGHSLCETLLEPLLATFGHVAIRSAYRSAALHERRSKYRNMASIEKNCARHIGDLLDKNDKMSGTACVVIPWFVEYLAARADMSWKAMAWWIHDHLPYSEVMFFHSQDFKHGAFNIRWHESDIRRSIKSTVHGSLTKRPRPKSAPGAHASEYPGFPTLKPWDSHYPDRPTSLDTSHCAIDSGFMD